MKLLLDTHIWFWTLTEPERLSRRVRTNLESGRNELWLSPISAWELMVLGERGRMKFDGEARQWVAKAFERTPIQEAVLNHEVAIRSREIMPRHGDPADRFLVATALVYGLTLVTADATLVATKACPILANR